MIDGIVSSAEAHDVARVGGKAAALAALVAQGFEAPPFLVLTADAFDGDALRDEVVAALPERLRALGPGPYAVRSSAREEDGAHHSHAGQFLSLLDVASGDVADAAQKVWLSGAAESVEEYREHRGLTRAGGRPAALVQRMANARAAGVCFTADPVTGRRARYVVSAVAGLGDRLVSGEVDGETYALDARTGAVLDAPPGERVLDDADLAKLRDLAARVETARGGPQDIEWAFEGETLYLLQSRPITTALAEAPIADETRTIFDNSNIVESYPGLVSPLTYSFAQYAYARVYRMFVKLIGVSDRVVGANAPVFDNMLGRLDGRVYYNLVNWYRALALLPGFANNRAHMETMMGVGAPLPAEIADGLAPPPQRGLAGWRERARVAKMAALLAWRALRLKAMNADFRRRLDAAVTMTPAEVAATSLTGLARDYRRIEADLLDRWDAPLVNDFLCMIAFGGSRKLMERWIGEAGLELHNALMIGQGDIVSAEPARRIAAMAALAREDKAALARLEAGDATLIGEESPLGRDLAAYLARFSDRCAEELKLESVTFDHDPSPLLAAVAAAAASPAQPARERGGASLADALPNAPFKRAILRPVVAYASARVRDRENLRFERTRIFGHARRVLVAMGRQFAALGLIEEPRDVFFLTVQETLGAIEGFGVSADLRGLVALRKREMEAAGRRCDPPERVDLRGAAVAFARSDDAPSAPADEARERGATGCSAGLARGVARVILDPRRQTLAKGEILVSRNTDPGWIAIFSNAAAMVVERGSLLSHSAIVAREMGVPCVVGLKGATQWIKDGEVIEVDGKAGRVRKING